MNNFRKNHFLAALLALSAITLTSLVPGGPIENRDFSHISPLILLSFNVFLTVLGLGSVVLAAAVLREVPLAISLTLGAGLAYLLVYVIDLVGWFPKSPTPMTQTLLAVEIVGIALAIPMLALAAQMGSATTKQVRSTRYALLPAHLIVVSGLISVALMLVAFATYSAMGLG